MIWGCTVNKLRFEAPKSTTSPATSACHMNEGGRIRRNQRTSTSRGQDLLHLKQCSGRGSAVVVRPCSNHCSSHPFQWSLIEVQSLSGLAVTALELGKWAGRHRPTLVIGFEVGGGRNRIVQFSVTGRQNELPWAVKRGLITVARYGLAREPLGCSSSRCCSCCCLRQ